MKRGRGEGKRDKEERKKDTHRQIGKEVSHFLAGVYCSPPSICSHIVNLSQTPELDSNGTPSTK